MEVSAYVCFSEGLGFTGNQDQVDEFWVSIEENAPYGQYLSVLHELFRFIYLLTKIPGMKERMILTENNNPGIGKIIGVCQFPWPLGYNSFVSKLWLRHHLDCSEDNREAV